MNTTREYVVTITHNFDCDTETVKFTDYRKATAYLHWLWEDYYNNEIAAGSHLDENNCYHEGEYGRVQWDDDSGSYTEFILSEILTPREDFPADWEKYVCEDRGYYDDEN